MDRQTLLVRRAIAAGVGLLLVILLVLGVRGCLNSRREQAMKDYTRDAAALLQESDQQSRSLFGLLSGGGGRERAVDIENSLNQLRITGAQLVERARKTDHPGQVDKAQRYLLETLELRRDGLAAVADSLPTALGDQQRRESTDRVTAQMQTFLASDVICRQRFEPSLQKALDKEHVGDEVRAPASRFVPNVGWLQATFVAQRVSRIRTGRGGGGPASPGTHGNGLGTVSVAGQALTPGSPATIKLGGPLDFEVQVANQGENTETDVGVHVTVGSGSGAPTGDATLPSIAAGETKTVKVTVDGQPPTGQNVDVTAEIDPVPGEKKTDNNKQTYSVIFTR